MSVTADQLKSGVAAEKVDLASVDRTFSGTVGDVTVAAWISDATR